MAARATSSPTSRWLGISADESIGPLLILESFDAGISGLKPEGPIVLWDSPCFVTEDTGFWERLPSERRLPPSNGGGTPDG
jgi:hypothetical protein